MMKPIRSNRKKGERGATLILFTFLTVLVLIPVIGLAIDGAVVMWEKARLSSSVDAAAYAAGRSLSLGSTTALAKSNAATTARTYFYANFPLGNMNTSAPQLMPGNGSDIPDPVNGLWTIPVSATVNVPLYFLRILGFNSATLSASAQVTRKNVNIMLVLDRSASLSAYDSGASCAAMKAAAQNFTSMFVPGDKLGLVTFQTTANVDYTPGPDFKNNNVMSNLIGNIQCVGYTNTVSALKLAYDQITQVINQPLALNVIVFFSDGRPDAITANFLAKPVDNRNTLTYPFTYGQVDASTCTTGTNTMNGVLVALDEFPDAAASTLGILPNNGTSINATLPSWGGNYYYGLFPYPIDNQNSSPGCTFSYPGNQSFTVGNIPNTTPPRLWCSGSSCDMRKDIYVIPSTDVYGNATNTPYYTSSPNRSFSPSDGLFPSCADPQPRTNCIRPDTATGIVFAATNAAFEQVKKIRADKTYKPVVYTIGLGQYVDPQFMMDLANDPASSIKTNIDSNSPMGQYVAAPTAAQLSAAFQQIASQVLRISQ